MILPILWAVLIVEVVLVVAWLIARKAGTPRAYGLQREVDLRLTYKRYTEIYPATRMSYQDYKRMQSQRAYRRAVSSTKIKRMVR